uniref:Uncharacterized protein n=1 Tax=Anguilla anguilla TaxID=7936 RepID=A0A0E9TCA0_ANGAN
MSSNQSANTPCSLQMITYWTHISQGPGHSTKTSLLFHQQGTSLS